MAFFGEAFHHVFDTVLDASMITDFIGKFFQFRPRGQNTPDKEIGGFEEGTFFGEFLNPNAPILREFLLNLADIHKLS